MKTLNITGVPAIIFPHKLYEECMGWMNSTPMEVSWRGLADWNENNFFVRELFFPIQRADVANVRVPTAKEGGDMGKWTSDCIRAGKYSMKDGESRYKLHMHKHPGDEWSDLFESQKDLDNTAEFGSRDIDWMMVGRGVSSGKMRICLEIFKPLRVSIDHLPVYVEYNGTLFLTSAPFSEPVIEKDISIMLPDDMELTALADKKACHASVDVKAEAVETAYYQDFEHLVESGSYHYANDLPLNQIRERQIMSIVKISEKPIVSDISFQLRLERGIFMGNLEFKTGPWNISVNNFILDPKLPIDASIRKAAAMQVEQKLTVIEPPRVKRRVSKINGLKEVKKVEQSQNKIQRNFGSNVGNKKPAHSRHR